jgi:hypothetical protein
MTTADETKQDKRRELERLYEEARRLEGELQAGLESESGSHWPPRGYYTIYHMMVGMLLGFVGASASLLFNVVGSLVTGQHPMRIIQVYLTFPLGAEALTMQSGVAMGVGTCLYLATGTLYGVAFHLVMSRWFEGAPAGRRFAAASCLGIGLWIVNFYGILSWLQPMTLGGNWIVTLVPFWVAAATHLVFAWSMLVLEQWGSFVPYRAAD